MADAVTESMIKLQLDEETGEMVSKGELKKRIAKRAKKAAAKARADAAPNESKKAPNKPKVEKTSNVEPNNMFMQGWLDEVYRERPIKPVTTRFPPEPNGYLHIGHAKAIAVNFGFAKFHGGNCYLRFDDTNPEAEEEKYFTAIKELVEWLGFKPYQVTYSSDNFDRLYEKAEELIRRGRAYICHCGDAEIKSQRGGEERGPRYRCAHADQSVEHNLTHFRAMRDGKYKPKEAFLRMKQDIEDGNPQMWDLAAYRVLDAEHHRTGAKWKIYPTYDFTHCLCDSFERITHSLCTTEFIQSRVSYEWLNKTLEVYEPMQREYGRLSITGTVLSKRKIMKLVNEKIVRGWDDPRLYTLIGIRRRGVPPGAILEFVNEIGVTTAPTIIQVSRFDQTIRKYLECTVPRLMLVLDPIPVVIEDAEEIDLEIPFSPKIPMMGTHKVRLTKTVYIERADFREVDSKNFYRLAPGKSVGLLQIPFPIKTIAFTKENDKITEVRAVYDKDGKKPKTYIHWVPEGSRYVEVRIHEQLFKSEKPENAEGGFLSDINPHSEKIWPNAMIESGFDEVKTRAPWPRAAGESESCQNFPESVRFQAMRVAYMAMDSESTDEKIILNRIVSLKEDAGK
ncbi:putative glutamine--tRNA ligase [Golovinomyces cichoracearum]|uniref:glutamine--tRNA ligase n=1 Tax=Golovinomyces cichoracearum TaxID=62708 RepID=A0A420IVL4_9PEZI|nr:putative glutamine--tRNA ligase [Golovinomyces cichoracearum]